MMKIILDWIKGWVKNFTLKDFAYMVVIFLLLAGLSTAVSTCSRAKKQSRNNIEALKDTIKYFKDKNGNLVATKLAFESDIKTLKLLNEDLYKEIEDLKLKGSVSNIVYVGGTVEYEPQDTAYIVLHDTISRGFTHDFAFNNEYRTLEGNVKYRNDTVGVNILKDEMKFDYTVAMDKDNHIYIKSTNPYVKYSEISGYTVPKERRKRWSLGPSVNVGYGYNIVGKQGAGLNVSVGVSLNYGIFQW